MSVGCNEVEIVPQIHVLLEAHHLALFGKRVFADVKGHPGLRVGLKSDNWCLSQRVEGGLILRHAGRGHGAMEAHPGEGRLEPRGAGGGRKDPLKGTSSLQNMRAYISVLSHQVWVICYSCPRERIP